MTNENNRLRFPLVNHVDCVTDSTGFTIFTYAGIDPYARDVVAIHVAAVNACHQINPADPMAVAKHLPELVREVLFAAMTLRSIGIDHPEIQSASKAADKLAPLLAAVLPEGKP